MAVNLHLDTRELANQYDIYSNSQFRDGCILLDKLALRKGYSVLDIGCGTGSLVDKVLEYIGDTGRYIGIDPLSERIAIANAKNTHSNADFKNGVAEQLDFVPSASIDVVYLNWVFHWIADKNSVLQELERILKPGGKIGITVPCKELHGIIGLTSIADRVLKREPYHQFVRTESSTQKQYNLTMTEWTFLFIEQALKIEEIHLQVGQRTFQRSHEITEFMAASFFGNYLNHVPESMRKQAICDIEAEYEKYRTDFGLQFDYYLLYAVLSKSVS
jgi:ubiquinone/menaquinone biosynthesis C-methylase UbiE